MSNGRMAGILRAYQNVLRKHPIIVQSIQVGALMGLGDAIAQTFVERKGKESKPFNFIRNRNFILLGTFVVGPAQSQWFKILDRYIKGKRAEVVLKKMVCDQLIFAPFFLAVFLILLETLEKRSLSKAQKSMRLYYFDILKANYTVWPLVQLCNFYLVPVNYQTLLVQVVAIAWNTFISYRTHV
ncbi:hypothetical protein HHI36_005425 [Cryptolaemus montrouzieri]|uniref:Mitochondrial inner membrane protein Mpv17 n=1 Tax=Cryptolaemus montrouzieri TaxID=559131 RepID=A0ABD2NU33_9CUCU